MGMLELSKRLLYYKRKDIQKEIVDSCIDKEVGIKYGESGFGKRPDILSYENDVLESVKRGATSFHVSEERWISVMQLTTEMKKQDLDNLRKGWDFVLDIDCPFWEYSKISTFLFIKALKLHGINSISCKFSGNKGFHIGVPFEVFPQEINNQPIKNWFPDGPKKIALYLLDYIENNLITIKNGEVNFDNVHKTTIEEISKTTKKTKKELSLIKCIDCKTVINRTKPVLKTEFICSKCGQRIIKQDRTKVLTCPKCKILMEKVEHKTALCQKCGSNKYNSFFNPLAIVNVDTLLISSRHLYRAPYSMHEKSGLVSLPLFPDEVLSFQKEMAIPEKVSVKKDLKFLTPANSPKVEAKEIIINAFDYKKEELIYKPKSQKSVRKDNKFFEEIGESLPMELFPPCMIKMLSGLEDGRKRSLFVLTNFLTSVGWTYDKIDEALLHWNKKNKEPLRDGMIKSQVRYHQQKNKKILPPNCRSYYQDFRVCLPDSLCDRIKNPVQYSKRKAFLLNKKGRKSRKLSDEQKEVRRKYREKLKRVKSTLTKK